MSALRRFVDLKVAVPVAAAMLILAFAGVLVFSLREAHRQIVGDAAARAESLLVSAEAATERTLIAADAVLRALADGIAERSLQGMPTGRELEAMLRRSAAQLPIAGTLMLLEADGRPIARSAPPRARHLLGDLVAPRGADAPGEASGERRLSVGPPRVAEDGSGYHLLIARPVTVDGGRRLIVAAEVPVAAFAESLRGLTADGAWSVTILDRAGRRILREPVDALAPGVPDPDAATAARLGTGSAATYGAVDGDGTFSRWRALETSPLVVRVRLDEDELLRGWRHERRDFALVFAMITATIVALTWALLRLLRRREQHLAEIRRNEARFVQQSALLQSTLEHMGEGLCVFDRNLRLLAWNDRFVGLLDLPSGVGFGTRYEDVLRLQARRGDFGPVDIEAEVRHRIDLVRTELGPVAERTEVGGRILEMRRRRMPAGGFVTLWSDVTERQRFENEMIEARNQAEIANRAKGEFLANMSHELRTPLNAIIGFSDILRTERFGAIGNRKYQEYAHDIHLSGVHLLDLISDVLDMSKIEAGKLELFEEEVALDELVASCLSMVRERARERGIRIRSEIASPGPLLWADMRALKQVVLNLLSNAVKFSHEGGTVELDARVAPDGSTVIGVLDSGIGMTDDQIARAREPFGQAHASTTRKYGGTGLGLPISQRLIELHGGRLEIESRLGEGTRVSVVIPAARALPAPVKQSA